MKVDDDAELHENIEPSQKQNSTRRSLPAEEPWEVLLGNVLARFHPLRASQEAPRRSQEGPHL